MRVLFHAKMLTETKETIFFAIFLSLVAFQLGGGPGPLAMPMPQAPYTFSQYLVSMFVCDTLELLQFVQHGG